MTTCFQFFKIVLFHFKSWCKTKMTSSEKFCLKWNDFQENIACSFNGLREDPDFSDVTLVCEENNQIEAHKVILSACSPLLSSMLKRNKHSHPLIYMRGLKSKDLVSIMDFIYHGEANIYQEDLDAFLALAEELQLKGLTGSNEEKVDNDTIKTTVAQTKFGKPMPKQEITLNTEQSTINHEYMVNDHANQLSVPSEVNTGLNQFEFGNGDLEGKISSMMESINDGEYRWKCTVCGKLGKKRQTTSRHVESHLEGVSHPCNLCDKVSRSSNALRVHIQSYHLNYYN